MIYGNVANLGLTPAPGICLRRRCRAGTVARLAGLENGPGRRIHPHTQRVRQDGGRNSLFDVTFNEDHCRIRDRNAVQNFSLLRKIAINLVRRHHASKTSLKGRRKMAAWDNRYKEQVLTGILHA